MNILVTGAAGFVGGHICEKLVEEGHYVIGYDNISGKYSADNLKNIINNNNFSFYKRNVEHFDALEDVFSNCRKKIHAVIHLAAKASVMASVRDPFGCTSTNIYGTVNVLENAKRFGVEHFVFFSSSTVYGSHKTIPFTTELVPAPICPYGASKASGEIYCRMYSELTSMKLWVIRPFSIYGPRGRPDMAPFKFADLVSSGKSIEIYGNPARDFVYISDVVDAVMGTFKEGAKPSTVNLSYGSPTSLVDFANLLGVYLGKEVHLEIGQPNPEEMPVTCADIRSTKTNIFFSPKVDINRGVELFIEWYMENKDGR